MFLPNVATDVSKIYMQRGVFAAVILVSLCP